MMGRRCLVLAKKKCLKLGKKERRKLKEEEKKKKKEGNSATSTTTASGGGNKIEFDVVHHHLQSYSSSNREKVIEVGGGLNLGLPIELVDGEKFCARVEGERVWLEFYQVGHLGFGRVSFTGIPPPNNKTSTTMAAKKEQRYAELRLRKDIRELSLPLPVMIEFLDPMNFDVTLLPDLGFYQGGIFVFSFHVTPLYPHEAPKVNCKTKVYHPNIDLEGNVRLDILGEDWRPVIDMKTVIRQLYNLFKRPNPKKPLNFEAADMLESDPKQFESIVQKAVLEAMLENDPKQLESNVQKAMLEDDPKPV